MYHFVLWCIFRDFAVTLSFPDCYRWFSHILNDTLRSVPSTLIEHGDGLDFGTTISFLLHCCLYKIEYSTSKLTKKTTALGLSGRVFLMVGL